MASPSPHHQSDTSHAFFTEILRARDSQCGLFNAAKKEKLKNLISRGTFRLVMRSNVGEHPISIPLQFLLALKHNSNCLDVFGARIFVDEHNDPDKGSVVHKATTLKQVSLWILLAVAFIFGSKL